MRLFPRQVILVVEDDESLLSLVAGILEEDGFHIEQAHNGREALERIAVIFPTLILLDMKMPVMDGWGFAREFKRLHDRKAPIVVMTAAESAADRAAEIGAAGYLSKPFDLDALTEVVKRFTTAQSG